MPDGASSLPIRLLKLPFSMQKSSLVIAVTLAIVLGELVLGTGGFVEVEPGEVAVVYNNTGLAIFGEEAKTVVEQGVISFLPGIQSVEVLERRPQILLMQGDGSLAATDDGDSVHRVKALTVRAKDGSNFYFGRLEIHYQIQAALARTVIETSGPHSRYKQDLLATHARQILRDEFGRYSFLEIADPTTYGQATTAAKRRLNERLTPLGLEVTQIITPKPNFEGRVENAIENRQNSEQEVEVQGEKRRKLEQEAGLKVQAIEQLKNAEYQTLLAEMEAQKKASENRLIAARREADKYFIAKTTEGEAYEEEKITRATANEVAYRKQAEGLVAKITAVGAQGADVLNSVIAKHIFPQLGSITASPMLTPTTPIDLRHVGNQPR